jgi:sugar O-acyltransferase (sialic acid O-acetyltransferase NeuD family)
MSARPLIIIGTGGSAYDVMDVVDALNARESVWRMAGFLDDGQPAGSPHAGLTVLGPVSDAAGLIDRESVLRDALFVNVVGSDRSYARRRSIVERTGLPPERFATLVHPLASVSPRARLGRGVCVNYGVSVAGQVRIGDHVWLGPGSIVGHDSVIGDHALLAPAAVVSGHVVVQDSCYIGAGAHIRHQLVIGAAALVGMSAVVVKDVAPGAVVAGNPAREISRSTAGAAASRR